MLDYLMNWLSRIAVKAIKPVVVIVWLFTVGLVFYSVFADNDSAYHKGYHDACDTIQGMFRHHYYRDIECKGSKGAVIFRDSCNKKTFIYQFTY